MVVHWTDIPPDRPGHWIFAVKFEDSEHYYPNLVEVYDDKFTGLVFHCELFAQMKSFLVEDVADKKIRMKYDGAYEIKWSKTPLQIKNIDWDYKLTKDNN